MSIFGAYVVSGLVLGSIYALAGLSISFTYKTTGIFNFALAAISFFIARIFYQLAQVWGWNRALAIAVSVLVISPAFGVFLWLVLFRYLSTCSTAIRIVSTIGLLIALPALTTQIFGYASTLNVVGLGSQSTAISPDGVAINWNQIVTVLLACGLAAGMAVLLKMTRLGLVFRAVVDSPYMAGVYGASPNSVSVAAWIIGSALAGIVGILIAPLSGLDSSSFEQLIIACFATVALANLDRLVITFFAGIGVGLFQELLTKYVPTNSTAWSGVVPASPFLVLLVVCIWRSLRAPSSGLGAFGGVLESMKKPPRMISGGTISEMILGTGQKFPPWVRYAAIGAVSVIGLFVLPHIFDPYWLGVLSIGIAYGVIFMGFVVITGETGVISLCQSVLVGIGAITIGQIATVHHMGFWVGLLAACAVVAVVSMLLGLFSARLGELYVALLTIGFGFCVENMLYVLPPVAPNATGVPVRPPSLFGVNLQSGTAFFVFAVIAFLLVGVVIQTLQKTTLGLVFGTVRGNRLRAAAGGIRSPRFIVLGMVIGGIAAAIGAGLLTTEQGIAFPVNYPTATGIVWFAVMVTLGVRSLGAALAAGIAVSVGPALVSVFLPTSFANLTTILFGLGALHLAIDPRGSLAVQGNLLRVPVRRLIGYRGVGKLVYGVPMLLGVVADLTLTIELLVHDSSWALLSLIATPLGVALSYRFAVLVASSYRTDPSGADPGHIAALQEEAVASS